MSRLTPNNLLVKGLVAYYGLLQFVHLVALIRALQSLVAGGEIGFLAMAPVSGWSTQAQNFLIGLGVMDATNVLLALVFVYSFFKMERWWVSTGLVSLTAAMCSAGIYSCGTAFSDAWSPHPWAYGVMVFLFSPVFVLFLICGYWGIKGRILYEDEIRT